MLTAALGSSFIHNRSVSAEPKPLAETAKALSREHRRTLP